MRAKRGTISLHAMMILCIMLAVTALLAFLSLFAMGRISEMLRSNALERNRDTMQQSASNIEENMGEWLSLLHAAADLIPSGDIGGEYGEYATQFALISRGNSQVSSISFFAENGALHCSTAGSLSVSPEEIAGRHWFAKALEWGDTVPVVTKPHIQNIFAGYYEQVLSLSRAVRYTEGGQAQQGVLLIDYKYQALPALLENMRMGANGYYFIIDERDDIIYHPDLQLLYAGLAEENLAAVLSQVIGVCYDTHGGRERILNIATIGQTRLRLVGVSYLDEMLSVQIEFTRFFSISLAAGALLSFLLATTSAYLVAQPIRRLQDKIQLVEQGNLEIEIREKGFLEIRALTNAFNRMLARVRDLMARIVEEQEAKRLHELNALQAQINPHFLYNTLDSIIWIGEQGRSGEAVTMVSALARLFRISISQGRNIITIREEMEHVRNYLIIQKMRFKNAFTYEIDTDEELMEHRTLKLIVQPLVENAIHHAINPYADQALHIAIRCEARENALVITVADNGIGIAREKLETILENTRTKSGIGLRNVHERIMLSCGREYGLRLESVEDEGTTVTITQPLHMEETP